MTLPKIVYENLPYIYYAISGYLLTLDRSWPMLISAILFYGAASITLVTRSSHRRLDRHKSKSIKHYIPELLYEYLPYSYLSVAIFGIMATDNAIWQFAAFILIILAVRNLVFRHNNRAKPPSLF